MYYSKNRGGWLAGHSCAESDRRGGAAQPSAQRRHSAPSFVVIIPTLLTKIQAANSWDFTLCTRTGARSSHGAEALDFLLAMQSWEYIDSSGKYLAEEIRQYFTPDFSE